jgi:peptidyl-prolyl cis-trans isomerase SurA
MLRRAHALFLILLCLALPPAALHAAELDRIVATVNDDIITQNELETRTAQLRARMQNQKLPLPAPADLRRQVLERLVLERIQLQRAAQFGMKIGDEQVETTLQRLRQQHGADKFAAQIRSEGYTDTAFRDELRRQLTIQQLVERELLARISVSDEEIETLLASAKAGRDTEFNVSHILLPLPEPATPEAVQRTQKAAEELVAQLRKGADFRALAIRHSRGGTALEGGALGWKPAGQLPDLFVNALTPMTAGQVSEPLRGPNGFHILKLNERRGGLPPASVTQTRARHILLRIHELMTEAQARAELLALRARIEHGEDFAALARARSDDTVSANRGGDLNWINPGQTVPPFEHAMNALKPGEISEPVRSPFGLHLIQVLERRTQDVTSERAQAAARAQIRARKLDERHEQWLRQLRDEAFVVIVGDEKP